MFQGVQVIQKFLYPQGEKQERQNFKRDTFHLPKIQDTEKKVGFDIHLGTKGQPVLLILSYQMHLSRNPDRKGEQM